MKTEIAQEQLEFYKKQVEFYKNRGISTVFIENIRNKMTDTKIPHKNIKVSVNSHTGEIAIMGEDNRCAFTIRAIDGHNIEIGGGQTVKDVGVIYTEQLQITPSCSNRIIVSKARYED